MNRKISWLDKVAEDLKKKEQEKKLQKTASAKKVEEKTASEKVKLAKRVIIRKDLVPKAQNGNTVAYKGFGWKVVNASYKDKKGEGIVLQKIAEISNKKVTDPAEKACVDPGNIYDYEVRDSYEVPELQQTAAETEKKIGQENAVDRTTPAGRATNPYKEEELGVFNEIIEETPAEEAPVEEAPAEEVVEEVPAEEAPAEEAPVEEAPAAEEEEKEEEVKEAAAEEVTAECEAEEAPAEEVTAEAEEIPAEHDMEAEKECGDKCSEKTAEKVAEKVVEKTAEAEQKPMKRENPIIASILGKKKEKEEQVKQAAVVRTANSEKIAKISARVAAKLDDQMEKILSDAEELVKAEFPAKYVSASLTRLSNILCKEGIECTFDSKVSREAIRKTASSDITKDECYEAIKKIAEAVVDETEDTIEQCKKAIDVIASKEFEAGSKVATRRIQRRVASRLGAEGLQFKF